MKMEFKVVVSTDSDSNKLNVEIHRPNKIAKKWGSLALLTHMGIMKGLQDAYKIADGQMVEEQNRNETKQS